MPEPLEPSPRRSQLPPPLPGPEAAARRAQDSGPYFEGFERSRDRGIVKAVVIGLSATAVSIAIPILIVVILAIVAQAMISGH